YSGSSPRAGAKGASREPLPNCCTRHHSQNQAKPSPFIGFPRPLNPYIGYPIFKLWYDSLRLKL
ncbi:hypothetical protein, partial [Coleofasciculus sp. E2-BRE-01]|uniref:hypothetical protein n=1 Tax=Coleofasciculus sp. E2-BRE-01 TaxID=3069524 RepID=UPI0033002F28